MRITIRYYQRKKNFEPDYSKETIKSFVGENAADCMAQIKRYRNNHDLNKCTPTEIINVEDDPQEEIFVEVHGGLVTDIYSTIESAAVEMLDFDTDDNEEAEEVEKRWEKMVARTDIYRIF